MSFADRLLDLVYPPHCAFCRRRLWKDALACPECIKSLPYTGAAARGIKIAHIADCVSPLYYEGDVRASLLRYKFHSLTAYSKVYSKIIVNVLTNVEFPAILSHGCLCPQGDCAKEAMIRHGCLLRKLRGKRTSPVSGC